MPVELRSQVRKEQTERELEDLAGAIGDWLKHRTDDDKQGFHATQLQAIRSVLLGAVDELRSNLALLDLNRLPGNVYDECRDYDEAIVWLERLWDYFRAKFDQRDDQHRLGPLLKAADEVVWSCYRQVVLRARARDPRLPLRPSPLAFVAPEYSPAAVQSDRPLPPDLVLSADLSFLADYVKSLPVPVVRLPPWCIDSPWWLIYVGHEVGHHIQHDLNLVGHVREGLEQVAAAHHLPESDVKLWGRWGEEIFADVFSVITMGPWAVWAIAEVERSTPAEMVKPKQFYPPPIIRLALLARTAEKLKMDLGAALDGILIEAIAATSPRTQRDLGLVDEVVAFVRGPLRDQLGTLESLCGLEPQAAPWPHEKVERWAKLLRGQLSVPLERYPETARQLASGALCAWASVAGLADPANRAEQRAKLAARIKEAIVQSAAPGTRASGAPGEQPGKGRELAQRLLQASRQRRAEQPEEGS